MTTASHAGPRIMTLIPMAFDGVGPSQTCRNLMRGAHAAGHEVLVHANRRRRGDASVPMRLTLPGTFSGLPYKWISARASRRTEARFLKEVREGDVAYLWPAASLEAHRVLHRRGVPVVLEGINTRMASAKRILDAAYEAFGIPPAHAITEARIAEEEEKYRHASAIFAPNRHVEAALVGSPLEGRVIPASYGAHLAHASPERDYPKKDALTFMFCGYACVRKGVHLLLDAWRTMPKGHVLQLVGRVEPAIAERYADLLAGPSVEVVGFVDDVHAWFARADVFVFPSLEEGGPQVTYEAALHGLPMLTSPMGAGRLEEIEDALICIDPARREALAEALRRLAADRDLRAHLGRTARRHAPYFDWGAVGARRAERLKARLAAGLPGL